MNLARRNTRDNERKLINQYFKYEKLLKQNNLYSQQRGSIQAQILLHNKMLSELLGYPSDFNKYIRIYTTNRNVEYTKMIETNKNNPKVCLICGGNVSSFSSYSHTAKVYTCDNCKSLSQKTEKFSTNPLVIFYEKGKKIQSTSELLTFDYEDEFVKIKTETPLEEEVFINCCCKWISKSKKYSVLNILVKEARYKPIIYIDDYSSYNVKSLDFVEKINKAHSAVLGWRTMYLKYGLPPEENP